MFKRLNVVFLRQPGENKKHNVGQVISGLGGTSPTDQLDLDKEVKEGFPTQISVIAAASLRDLHRYGMAQFVAGQRCINLPPSEGRNP